LSTIPLARNDFGGAHLSAFEARDEVAVRACEGFNSAVENFHSRVCDRRLIKANSSFPEMPSAKQENCGSWVSGGAAGARITYGDRPPEAREINSGHRAGCQMKAFRR
jgi:hypothetical protein